MTIKEVMQIIKNEVEKLDWDFPVEIRELALSEQEIMEAPESDIPKEELIKWRLTGVGITEIKEHDGADRVRFFAESFIWSFDNMLSSLRMMGITTLEDFIHQTVIHEHRHMLQMVELRKSNFDLTDVIKIETWAGSYGMGPMEKDAFRSQVHNDISIDQFIIEFVAVASKYYGIEIAA